MQRASQLFNEEQRKLVEQAVEEAEGQTCCEIVPAVATASGRYDRAEDIIGLWLVMVTVLSLWLLLPPGQKDNAGSWGAGLPLFLELLILMAAIAAAFIAGATAGGHIGWLRRLFTPRLQMQEEVAARAREVFFDNRVHHTAGSSGLLFYISLFERTAMVLSDEIILDKLGQPFLDQLCQQLTDGLGKGHPSEALGAVIKEAGRELSGPLPRAEDDLNELQDTLVLID